MQTKIHVIFVAKIAHIIFFFVFVIMKIILKAAAHIGLGSILIRTGPSPCTGL